TTGQNHQKQQNVEKQKQQQPASRAEGNRERTTGQGGQPASQAQQSPAQPKQGQAQQKQGQQGQQVQQGTQGRAGQQAQQPKLSPQQGQTTTGANTQQPARQGSNATARQSSRAGNATVTLNESQRTHIQQTVFARSDIPRADHVNFAVRVGTFVPESVHL